MESLTLPTIRITNGSKLRHLLWRWVGGVLLVAVSGRAASAVWLGEHTLQDIIPTWNSKIQWMLASTVDLLSVPLILAGRERKACIPWGDIAEGGWCLEFGTAGITLCFQKHCSLVPVFPPRAPWWITGSLPHWWSPACSASSPPSTWQPPLAPTSGTNTTPCPQPRTLVKLVEASGRSLSAKMQMRRPTQMRSSGATARLDCGGGVSLYPKTLTGTAHQVSPEQLSLP